MMSQNERLLARLADDKGVWVPMPELARACSPKGGGIGIGVSRRIFDLREEGHEIVNYTENQGHKRLSFYMLVKENKAKK